MHPVLFGDRLPGHAHSSWCGHGNSVVDRDFAEAQSQGSGKNATGNIESQTVHSLVVLVRFRDDDPANLRSGWPSTAPAHGQAVRVSVAVVNEPVRSFYRIVQAHPLQISDRLATLAACSRPRQSVPAAGRRSTGSTLHRPSLLGPRAHEPAPWSRKTAAS